LYYNWHRYYNPNLGRYYQADPVSSQDFKRNILFKNLRLVSWGKDKYLYAFDNRAFSRYSLWVTGGPNSYSYVDNNPFTHTDPLGLQYFDINVSVALYGVLGLTGGVGFAPEGWYPYVGGAILFPAAGSAVTFSPMDLTPGWTFGVQAGVVIPPIPFPVGGQIGTSIGEAPRGFWEAGGVSPGITISLYYIWGPFFGPLIEKNEYKYKKQ